MSIKCTHLLMIFGALFSTMAAQNHLPFLSPFFFLCSYHGNDDQSNLDVGEVALSIAIEGNPESYVPNSPYRVTIESSRNFDGFLLTGLYTMSSNVTRTFGLNSLPSLAVSSNQPFGHSFICSIVHTYISHNPKQQLTFTWIAPQTGTGCISFLATATLRSQVLFKDTTVLQLCEEGMPGAAHAVPKLAAIHENGVIFRDDFDSSKSFSRNLWQETEGLSVGTQCGIVLYGNSAVACGSGGSRRILVTVPLNLTTASVVQFALSSGTCNTSTNGEEIAFEFSVSGGSCTNWTLAERIRAPDRPGTETHLVHLPKAAQENEICFRWRETATENERFNGCWTMDNVLITNLVDPPAMLTEDFDPVDQSNWLFFPGGRIQHKCQSENNALFFENEGGEQLYNHVTTRDLNLENEDDVKPLFEETFDYGLVKGWILEGGDVGQRCSELHQKQSAVFYKKEKTRRLCTPPLDLRQAGSIQFRFLFGSKKCSLAVSSSRRSKVFLYIEDDLNHSESLSTFDGTAFKETKKIAIPVKPAARREGSRICWTQKTHGGYEWDVWAVDSVRIYPSVPNHPHAFVQFQLTMRCVGGSENTKNTSVLLEFSTDHGLNWFPLYQPCRTGKCPATVDPSSSLFHAYEFESWKRVTLPLPIAALDHKTRFRWRQLDGTVGAWAIDNVFVGLCPDGCSGHGTCRENSCLCDYGYNGKKCESPSHRLPDMIMAQLDSVSSAGSSFSIVKGASLSYDCGVVASGKALVFNKDGTRQLQTVDLNTTQAGYIQFSVRTGSGTEVGKCPSPNSADEEIVLQFTCNGGINWSLLKQFFIKEHQQPQVLSFAIPVEARQPLCNFRWWQPVHSGNGLDVWAIDDISVTSTIYNTICLDFSKPNDTFAALDVHLGKHISYCGRSNTLGFTSIYDDGDSRYVITNTMHIGPSYVLQFELAMNCHLQPFSSSSRDRALHLEFSTDHGMTWELVDKGCWQPNTCTEYRPPSIYRVSEFPKWKRVVVILPPLTWSSSTRFRLHQEKWTASSNWALASLYIGQQCPGLCSGHGLCINGECSCDNGHGGPSCQPLNQLDKGLRTDFSLPSKLDSHWFEIIGGELVGANQGCGTILSGESLYFFKDSVRRAVTMDMNTVDAGLFQFYVQLGGQGRGQCFGVDQRQENLLVQYSTNGGITWHLLKELDGSDYSTPEFVHIPLPDKAKTPVTRFHWWQPKHSGLTMDQWAIDEIVVSKYENLNVIEDDFHDRAVNDQPQVNDRSDLWLTITDAMWAPYCGSADGALMFMAQPNDKFATSTDVDLKPGDVVQFRINVGCSQSFSFYHPVLLQYSHDAGMTWQLVERPCYVDGQCHGNGAYTEGSVYFPGTYGEWRTVIYPLDKQIAAERTNFRWWQKGGPLASFAIDDVYIGPPCPDMCNGRGLCVAGKCVCNRKHAGVGCWNENAFPSRMIDRFEDTNRPSAFWDVVFGGNLGIGCGVIGSGNALYFDGLGTRQARTIPLDTLNSKFLQFNIRIGSRENGSRCKKPSRRREGVIVDYTTNNGITWNLLRSLDPFVLSDQPQLVTVELPAAARTNSTAFRWWQPISRPEMTSAEWALDDVVIAINDSSASGFQEDFSPFQNDVWFMAMNAVPRITCQSQNNALEFSKNGAMRYAETWDYHVTSSTFLQFDIAMGCSGTYSTLYSIQLQYSVDMGRTWHPVVEECSSSAKDCSGYHIGNDFTSETFTNWTRVTLYLPSGAVSPATRFRWLQQTVFLRGNVWALDNIYLGEGCPWMCSGHGYCDDGVCVCDYGFTGEYCVPSKQLPMMLRDDFETGFQSDQWAEVYGGDVVGICDVVVSGKALTFYKTNVRMAVTVDMDVSMSLYIQFFFKYGCHHRPSDWPKSYSVLVQYSTNGGILWKYLHEIHYPTDDGDPRYFLVRLPTSAHTNATRFRFWQPAHEGHMKSVWAIDNIYIGGSLMNPDTLYETFDTAPNDDDWHFWPGGKIGEFCIFNTRSDTVISGMSAIVFADNSVGDRVITTGEISVNDMSVLQFDLNVGCTSESSDAHSIRLEYSTDYGKSWRLVVPPCLTGRHLSCDDQEQQTTVYYPGTTSYWQRVIVPLNRLSICGFARFRWNQGRFEASSETSTSAIWALDNVYIGMQCREHCGGHGTCMNGIFCLCDDGYEGELCVPTKLNPTHLKEDFEGGLTHERHDSKWLIKSGGESTDKCGTLLSGAAMHFNRKGERMLVTNDLDFSHATIIQFFIKLGCRSSDRNFVVSSSDVEVQSVLLRYSMDGGIHWNLLEQFDFHATDASETRYVVLDVPDKMKTSSARLQWWQPTNDGTHAGDWAIDQIYVGGNDNGNMVMQDSLSSINNDNWLMHPGARIQSACGGFTAKALHFVGLDRSRYAVTKDVMVTEFTYLQFYIAIGCSQTGRCYGVELHYSLDFGQTWSLVETECPMKKDIGCTVYRSNSVFTSDVYFGWNRITIKLPYYTRSKATRFRWIQPSKFAPEDSWAITSVYIGDECDCSCGGHGRCDRGKCLCDKGWIGSSCTEPSSPLPASLKETFTELPKSWNWIAINGGILSTYCGVLSSGNAMHMKGACTRQLVTRDLDLRSAMFVQFYFRFGCTSKPSSKDEGVIVQYSYTGGTQWITLKELYFNEYENTSYVNIEIPKDAKRTGVRIRWWQPTHPGQSLSDWAIDDIVVSGKEINPNELMDGFQSDDPDNPIWLQNNNVMYRDYCDVPFAVVGGARVKETVVLTTIDLNVAVGYTVQFRISVGCDASWEADVAPVRLEYSTDYGTGWRLVVDECLPLYPECNGLGNTASVYYAAKGWRRITIELKGSIISNATRFRWIQTFDRTSDQRSIDDDEKKTEKTSEEHRWALDDVFIGPRCRELCNGHGRCVFPDCFCDKGYGGDTCYQTESIQTSMFETFDDEPSPENERWTLVQGGKIGVGCTTIVDGQSLYFTGQGRRQAVTNDLDLRLASYIKYHVMIGGPSKKLGCGAPNSRDENIIVQYSSDGGITWHLLHVVDYENYWMSPKWDYISLPLGSRTNSTRFRWWQKVAGRSERPAVGWAVDDVMIGGMDINPSEMYETFEDGLQKDLWEFHPSGYPMADVCARGGTTMSWSDKAAVKMITTCQLIIQDGYVLQFKIVVGCGHVAYLCDKHQTVLLQYNKDPTSDVWDVVYPQCLDNSQNMECRNSGFRQGSIYSAAFHASWSRVTLLLPPKTFSSKTRFRWIQTISPSNGGDSPNWAIDDVFIAEKCLEMCRGRGDCINGTCHCDPGYIGPTCERPRNQLLSYMTDGFEGGLLSAHWTVVDGGGNVGMGCGSLLPIAHGKNLYFNGCGVRQAITAEMDLTKASKLMFALQIGSFRQTPTCNIRLDNDSCNGKIILQYTKNRGIDWTLLAVHNPVEFLAPRKVAYDIPSDARTTGVQIRWWQPEHRGQGFDQWAIDYVEIIITHQDQLMRDIASNAKEIPRRKPTSFSTNVDFRIV